MQIVEEQFKLVLPKSHGRSEGLHVSEVIRDWALNSKILDKKWVSPLALEEQNTNMMQIGLAWEDYLAKYQHPEIEFHPGELWLDDDDFCTCSHERCTHSSRGVCAVNDCQCEGFRPLRIFMSPDGVSVIDPDDYADLFGVADNFIHEFKFTAKSSRDFAREFRMKAKKSRMWDMQIRAYCAALGTLAAKLHVMFVMGDYSRDDKNKESKASYKVFRIRYTQDELDSNWELIKQHARIMLCR